MSQSYELMYVLRPDLMEEQIEQSVNKYRGLVNQYGADSVQTRILGKRRLAYEIKRHQDGIYVQMDFRGDGKQIAPLERDMRLSDDVIRYLTIKLDEELPVVEQETEVVEQKTESVAEPVLETAETPTEAATEAATDTNNDAQISESVSL